MLQGMRHALMQGTKTAQSLKRYALADNGKHTLEQEGGLDKKCPCQTSFTAHDSALIWPSDITQKDPQNDYASMITDSATKDFVENGILKISQNL